MFFPTAIRRAVLPRSTYYDKHYRQTAALIRARQQYLVKNLITGAVLTTFVIGIYIYTIHAIGQDDFEDVPIPASQPQKAQAPHTGLEKSASKDELDARKIATLARSRS